MSVRGGPPKGHETAPHGRRQGAIAHLKRATGLGLALGGGSARGLAHILMLEALDELGVKPERIAGTSIGAIFGALYASGLSGAEIREHTLETLASRAQLVRRLMSRIDHIGQLWRVSHPSVLDPVTMIEVVMPDQLRGDIAGLRIPFTAVATDYYAMSEVDLSEGPIIPAVAASAALPSILKPVSLHGRVLVDGGYVNPCPWDLVAPKSRITVAVDVTGTTARADGGMKPPRPIEAFIGTTQILFRSISREKMKQAAPDILIEPRVGTYGTLDFLKVQEIFAASEPAKDELKRALAARIDALA